MKKIKRSWVAALILLSIALVEGFIVLVDLLRPAPDKFQLAEAEINVPQRSVEVPQFVFENKQIKKLDTALHNLEESLDNSLLDKIISLSEEVKEPEATEKAPVEEKTQTISENIAVKSRINNVTGGKVMVAVVIDDMGVSVPHTRDILSLPRPITASFLTYGAANRKQVQEAKAKNFEVMLHVPMMPHAKADLAPVTLSPNMSESEIKGDFIAMLDRYKGLGMKGINNHMGSLFTEDAKSLGYVMQILKDRGLFFLDSKTTSKSVGAKVAAEYGVPYIARDVFLDNENDYDYIMKQLHLTEKIAHMRGYAVAIGHPRSKTYLALRDWMNGLSDRKIRLVRLGDLVREVNKKAEN